MLVLHDYKIIFLKTRKVAGTSFEIALSKFSKNDKDIITNIHKIEENFRSKLKFSKPRNYRYSFFEIYKTNPILGADTLPKGVHTTSLKYLLTKFKLPVKFKNHNTAKYIKSKLLEKVWNNYLKVSIVRNPFDCLLSYYFWKMRDKEIKKASFKSYSFNEWCYKIFSSINAKASFRPKKLDYKKYFFDKNLNDKIVKANLDIIKKFNYKVIQ